MIYKTVKPQESKDYFFLNKAIKSFYVIMDYILIDKKKHMTYFHPKEK